LITLPRLPALCVQAHDDRQPPARNVRVDLIAHAWLQFEQRPWQRQRLISACLRLTELSSTAICRPSKRRRAATVTRHAAH
jgi:hypothetical protein